MVAEECISNVRTVKSFATEQLESINYENKAEQIYKTGCRQALWTGWFFAAFNIFNFGSMGVIIYFGSVLYSNGDISLGGITNFLL